MGIVWEWLKRRPLRLVGTFLVFLSVGLIVFFILLDVVGAVGNPYLGIITYMVLPAVLILGLILVPLDAWIQRRRAARGERVYPVLDMRDPAQRRVATFFAISSVIILTVATVLAYRSVEFMDTRTFCGLVCHKVMIPEYTAYNRSSHSSVQCVPCHIGPGASWFVRSKLTGIPQVWHYILGDYDRPLQTPVKALRPSRETCETCHAVTRFYGSTLRTRITYRTDRDNTREIHAMLMYIGSGGIPGSGIHSHMVNRIHYLPASPKRDQIAWVRVRHPDGTVHEYANPDFSSRLPQLRQVHQTRLMDCIDCHNRAAHDFVPFEDLLDDGLTSGAVDPTLPFIKQQVMAAAGDQEGVPSFAQMAAALGRMAQIPSFYTEQMPAVASARGDAIVRSVAAAQSIYRDTYFPHMRVGPDTYPNWRSHAGCFRCHGVLQRTDAAGAGATLPADCTMCHSTEEVGTSVTLPVKP